MNKEALKRVLADLKRQLEVSDRYAAEENKDRLPSIWQIQNGHLRDYAHRIEALLDA